MQKLYLLTIVILVTCSCKVSSVNTKDSRSVYIQLDTAKTVIKNDYLQIEADIVNHSSDTILLLKPKDAFNEKIDYFSIHLDQGDTKGCGVETFELQAPKKPSYRFSNDFVSVGPKEKNRIILNGRIYDLLIYCQDDRSMALQISYQAIRFDGINSQHIIKHYIKTDKKELFAKSVEKFSNLYEGEIISDMVKFIPKRE
ncbi:hypothetical protein QQ020_05510 [Fulvivirgaceae bacterium BMA12]|uniref:Lipoprotein n=1 Tax=Agaribacillus aureus TaxID=3051825 RepID=A0ABT8L1D2_9BACT|nr:hypothetical protein [Fulvivirgaceae bacterium BMA12]